jgi:hypothetical protein
LADEEGAKRLIQDFMPDVTLIPAPFAEIDIDTLQDYQQLQTKAADPTSN